MKNLFKKFIAIFALVAIIGSATFINNADAYVPVKGYYKSNGTYVQPYVRSNPNGLKYDNYSWTPSQGLYNKTYGTKGSTWDTPTWTTDPEYYVGKSLYENKNSGSNINLNTTNQNITTKKTVAVPTNATLNYWGDGWTCDSGYYRSNNACVAVKVPANAKLNYLGNGWTCDYGFYRSNNACIKVQTPAHASLNYLGNGWTCDSGYYRSNNACVLTQN